MKLGFMASGRGGLQWRRAALRLLVTAVPMVLLTGARAALPVARGIDRPLHYRPDGDAFVVVNGPEFFNRPLYGGNTAFRADAGDKPEVSLYLPGRGGNLRLGIRTGAGRKWLMDARSVVTRYRPGSMLYEIRDPLLGDGTLHLTVLAMTDAEGVVIRTERRGASTPLELVWAFGGASGQRGARNGDIGTERVPISQYFQLQPEQCRDNTFTLAANGFTLRGKTAVIVGQAPPGSALAVANAAKWADLGALLASAGRETPLPVVVGRIALGPGRPVHLGLQRIAADDPTAYTIADLPRVFADAERHRRRIAGQIVVDTPDPFVNLAAPALCIAADGVWDETQGAFMHGAVAWRNKLLGWRGAYAGDALGRHDRTRRHLMNWLPGQITEPVPPSPTGPSPAEPSPVPPDGSVHLARNEPALHSNGALTKSHYDMNLPAIDILFRHLLWTGDLDWARSIWPVIERHLAWERRLFRRPFGPDALPLYEGYAAIWASDDLQYNGGGATHATAYNYYHNRMAARVARLLGKDAALYEREAERISQGMGRELWLADRGWFAEWRDLLGLRRAHPSAAVWTFYHTLDSEAATPFQAWQMTRFVDTQIPHIPIRGPGVPTGDYFTVSTTRWMPYAWSINNVVMAEAAHTALGYWQAGRGDTAFRLFKGCLLDSMFLGLCPGNLGMATYYDRARGESQRDFADAVGVVSRGLIEGLFGVRPDALAGVLRVRPGFPADWDRAAIGHPNFRLRFRREGLRETYVVEPKFAKPMALHLNVAALRDDIAGITVNGRPAPWRMAEDSVGAPRIEIRAAAAPRQTVVIAWRGAKPATVRAPGIAASGAELRAGFGPAVLREVADPQNALGAPIRAKRTFRARVTGALGHRTVFARVRQNRLTWWLPVAFEIRPAFEVLPAAQQDPAHLRFVVRNNTPRAINRAATIRSRGRVLGTRLKVPAFGQSAPLALPAAGLLPGSNPVTVDLGDKRAVTGVVTNWKIRADGDAARWDLIGLKPVFNDRVTRIFKNQYLRPRSPYVSLAIPTQGIGSWVHWDADFTVDDGGLRAAAKRNGNRFLVQGVPFQTPGEDDANIAFSSRWDNYPREIAVPLRGRASHAYLLLAGSTYWMQSRFDNGEILVTYADGSTERLPLHNPTTWWPIDQDYEIDDFQFRRPEPIPPRVDLRTGTVRVLDPAEFKGKGGTVPGGAATVLDLPLNPKKELKSLTVRALANEVVIGLMAVTLARTEGALLRTITGSSYGISSYDQETGWGRTPVTLPVIFTHDGAFFAYGRTDATTVFARRTF